MNYLEKLIQGAAGLARGMGVTFGEMLQKPSTVQYPEEKPLVAERFRGRHILQRHDNGLERCIGCALCAAACPAQAIYVEAAENTPDARYSPGERYAKVYEINMIRCIFCGFCEEACPVEAVVLTHQYELSGYDRKSFIYTKEMLLVPGAALPLNDSALTEGPQYRSNTPTFERHTT
ncbi:MAG: NADH-quinone oxidoreductase subunit NuoI [Chloroflexi bacterium]|nr:NADH-quinone oxidoreductase subunit NuoI [Chloroflexota bacterium]